MSKQLDTATADAAVPPVSEISIRVMFGSALSGAELAAFDRMARSRGQSREEYLVSLIREELAAAAAVPAAA